MKLKIVTKFNHWTLALLYVFWLPSYANCPTLSLQQKNLVKQEWKNLLQQYGRPKKKMPPPRVCILPTKFYEISQGSLLRSVYDRATDTIYLRFWDIKALRHELAHGWLERKFPQLPYVASENLAVCMVLTPLVWQETVSTERLRYFLFHPPTPHCQDPAAAAAILQLSVTELQSLVTP